MLLNALTPVLPKLMKDTSASEIIAVLDLEFNKP